MTLDDSMSYDVVVAGSGGSGLTAALAAADSGARVLVVESSPLLGGTTAISGGNLWIACNSRLTGKDIRDDRSAALEYLQQVTLGRVAVNKLEAVVDHGVEMLEFIERNTRLRLVPIDRPDYHPDFQGAADARGHEMAPLDIRLAPDIRSQLRTSATRAPITFAEGRAGIAADLVAARRAAGVSTQGAGLVAGLVEGCLAKRVEFRVSARATSLLAAQGCIQGIRVETRDGPLDLTARQGVVLATGGFEWNRELVRAHLPGPTPLPVTPPGARGDGLVLGTTAGAAIDNMTEAWWTAAITVPGETLEGQPAARNIVRELALPGSILVNQRGARFVNEATGYNELGKAFLQFDPLTKEYPNRLAWLIVDAAFRRKYTVATIAPGARCPEWFAVADTLHALAVIVGIDPLGLTATIERFNSFAAEGKDADFSRGGNAHDRFNGDSQHAPNPCLGPITEAPFYAVPIHLGVNGTKGGLRTNLRGQVLRPDGTEIAGLYACGDVAASLMGPGYPGTGGSLGPAMTLAYLAGRAVVGNPRI